MKKYQYLFALLSLIVFPWQASFAFIDSSLSNSFGFVFLAGNNIPVSYTGTSTTQALSFIQIQVSTSGAGCTSVTPWMQGNGIFLVSPGSSTIYLNTSSDWTNLGSIAKGLCPSNTTSRYMKVSLVRNQVNTNCTVNANCFTMSCSATGTVSGGLTGTLPTINCP